MAKIQPSFLTKELKYIQIDFNGYFNETTSRCQKHNYDSSVFIKKLFPASGFQTIDLMLVFLGKCKPPIYILFKQNMYYEIRSTNDAFLLCQNIFPAWKDDNGLNTLSILPLMNKNDTFNVVKVNVLRKNNDMNFLYSFMGSPLFTV